MSAQHPTPWRLERRDNGRRGLLSREWRAILDANGFFVAEGLDERTAREIVLAVNDRLSDLVRRLAESLDTAMIYLGSYAAKYRVSPPDLGTEPLHDTLCGVDITELLREARAAIGEGGAK